ncbi:glucokinase [Xanthobacter sp. TB0136]|uniref:glucokinase n=1 Tax=Xanthobacter sp. TB0136 TaxID=3459177 RepID=UPI00403A7414
MMLPAEHCSMLLADIGGTTTRLACAGADGVPARIHVVENDSHASLEDLLRACLHHLGDVRPRMAILALACPVEEDEPRLTNRNWRISPAGLKSALGFTEVRLVNDFVALAHGVPWLRPEDVQSIGPWQGGPSPKGPMLVCGPGTGLGTALVVPRADERGSGPACMILPSEAGHMRLGAVMEDEARLLAHMGPSSVEQVLSGPGLARIHAARTGQGLSPRAIIRAALGGQGEAVESCMLFLRIFGRVLGDLALAFEARGGVYIAGGVGQAMAPLMAQSPLRQAFENHPPFEARLAQVPLHVITHPMPGLVGAGRMGVELLQNL